MERNSRPGTETVRRGTDNMSRTYTYRDYSIEKVFPSGMWLATNYSAPWPMPTTYRADTLAGIKGALRELYRLHEGGGNK